MMLTARGAVEEKVAGLDAGADDYLAKPFAFPELVARVRAVVRRRDGVAGAELRVADLTLDTVTRTATRGGRTIDLTAKEYAILEALARRPGTVVDRESIIESVWSDDSDPGSALLDVYMCTIRRKVDTPFSAKLLQTVRGSGYRLQATSVWQRPRQAHPDVHGRHRRCDVGVLDCPLSCARISYQQQPGAANG